MDRPVAETSNNTKQSQETVIHAPAGFEPAILASELPLTHALDGVAIGISFGNIPTRYLEYIATSFDPLLVHLHADILHKINYNGRLIC
jgi:hypothetical protein